MNRLLVFFLLSVVPLLADFEAALRAFNAGDYGEALKQFVPEAEQGNAQAQNALGFLYERGLGVPKDVSTAAQWYRKSAGQDYGPGEYNYGLFCWHGTGVLQNDSKAIEWLERAARHGVYQAEFDLGNLYYKDGKGDTGQALAWWRKAAEHNVPAAAYNVAYMYAEGQRFAHDYSEAAKWYRVAAMQNYSLAQYSLALLYQSGQGVQADPVEARMWLELAARGGVKQAQQQLDSRASALSAEQLQTARRMAAEWQGPVSPTQKEPFIDRGNLAAKLPGARLRTISDAGPESYYPDSGYDGSQRAATGFFVNSQGGVLTSLQTVKSCRQIVVRTFQGERRAEPAGEDERLGLAVIAVEGGGGDALTITPDAAHDGRAVEVGYRLSSHNAATGSALGRISQKGQATGFHPETASDPPLAGGPVLNAAGGVIAVSLAGDGGMSLITGQELLLFLRANRVPLEGKAAPAGDLPEVAAFAKRSVVLVECKSKP